MAKEHTYYLPQGAHEFVGWAKNFVEVAKANQTAWGLPAPPLDGMTLAIAELEAKIALAESEKATRIDIRDKNDYLKQVRDAFRQYVNANINYNAKISDLGRANLRVHIRDTTRTTIERPSGHVRFWVKPLEDHNHRIDFVDESSGKKKIPYGINGAVLHSQILAESETPPPNGADLPADELMTSTPHVVEYGPESTGKRVAYAAAWQNEKGEKGEFSDIQVVVIP